MFAEISVAFLNYVELVPIKGYMSHIWRRTSVPSELLIFEIIEVKRFGVPVFIVLFDCSVSSWQVKYKLAEQITVVDYVNSSVYKEQFGSEYVYERSKYQGMMSYGGKDNVGRVIREHLGAILAS